MRATTNLFYLDPCVANRIYLIHEVNCYLGRPKFLDRLKLRLGLIQSATVDGFGSVWIASGELNISDYEEDAFKLVGPLPAEKAIHYLNQVRAILETAGLEVIEETIADD